MNVVGCPTATWPTSASSTFTSSFIAARSSAITNRVGVLKEAATVWPGSIWRDRITPSTGERMVALARLVRSVDNCASAELTAALAAARLATARLDSALAVSSSAREGTLPEERRWISSNLASEARVNSSVASACRTLALACSSAAWLRRMASLSFSGSICARGWLLVTLSLMSTKTSSIRPESSEPTETSLVGSRLPVAVTYTVISPRSSSTVAYCGPAVSAPNRRNSRTKSSTAPMAAMPQRLRRLAFEVGAIPRNSSTLWSGIVVSGFVMLFSVFTGSRWHPSLRPVP